MELKTLKDMRKCDEIIDSLSEFSIEDKYAIISSLYHSLVDTIKEEGLTIIEEDLKDEQ